MLDLSELSEVQTFDALLRFSSIVNGQGWLHVGREHISDFIGALLPLGASWHVFCSGATGQRLQNTLQELCVSHHQLLAHEASGPTSLHVITPPDLTAYRTPNP
jgi:hypothetical protein